MIRLLTIIGSLLCFVPVQFFGWQWSSESAPGWMKFHPVTYIFVVGALLGLGSLRTRYWQPLLSWRYGPFAFMAMVFVIQGIVIAKTSSDPTGAAGIAITSFLTPVLFLIAAVSMSREDWGRLAIALRVLLCASSILALVEAATRTSFIYIQEGHIFRAAGLMGHPLSGALVTGYMLVYLLTSNNRRASLVSVLPEIMLHAMAMFTYGGRTALALVPIIVAISILLPSPGVPLARRLGQRLGIALLLISGGLATQLEIDAVQSTISRFQDDSGSSETRFKALEIVQNLRTSDLLFGISAEMRQSLLNSNDLVEGIENPWLSLIMIFGLLSVTPMAITLILTVFAHARMFDRSAIMMTLFFLIINSSSISFGGKSLTIVQYFILVTALCQSRPNASETDSALPSP
jgi:hypothetical protein